MPTLFVRLWRVGGTQRFSPLVGLWFIINTVQAGAQDKYLRNFVVISL